MPKEKFKTVYVCTSCGEASPRWMGRCPSCGEWNTMVEDIVKETKGKGVSAPATGNAAIIASRLKDISTTEEHSRIITGISELDRVLGGGIVLGSVVLLGGEPGAGKSTLLLQLCGAISRQVNVLYITGEESTRQIKLRATRLRVVTFSKTSVVLLYSAVTPPCFIFSAAPVSVPFRIVIPALSLLILSRRCTVRRYHPRQEACRRSRSARRGCLPWQKRWKFPHLLWAMSIRTAQLPGRK